jgi:aspartyl-tRNA(Asn)/glutamyl-tRNA(Gln) amidotransferase subunit C
VEASEIQKIAHLARLQINDDVAEETARSITEVLGLVDQLQSANTEGVQPMAHPLDAIQTLRADEVTETNVRDDMQTIAPATEDGLFLVPKVID